VVRTLEAVCDELEVDLCLIRLRHIAARRRLREADTPGNRAAEAQCRAQLDVVLDLLVELKDDAAPRRPARARVFPSPRPPS
jgi:hypothetical protein